MRLVAGEGRGIMQLGVGHQGVSNLPAIFILLLKRDTYITTYYQLSVWGRRYILFSVVFSLKIFFS